MAPLEEKGGERGRGKGKKSGWESGLLEAVVSLLLSDPSVVNVSQVWAMVASLIIWQQIGTVQT